MNYSIMYKKNDYNSSTIDSLSSRHFLRITSKGMNTLCKNLSFAAWKNDSCRNANRNGNGKVEAVTIKANITL